MAEIKYKIKSRIGIVGSSKGWTKELNLISWNEKAAKFDLRSWTDDHIKMSKGITLTKDELINLRDLLNKINIDEVYSNDSIQESTDIDDIFDEL